MTETFSISGALPSGLAIIEASAGTGKTYALASLAVRYICEAGLSIDELLVVTFTRAAAAELRDRIRDRLTDALAIVAAGSSEQIPPEGEAPDGADSLAASLLTLSSEIARRRIDEALTNFDTATITTIHGFAQQALGAMGASAPVTKGHDLVGTDGELIEQACTDAMVKEAIRAPQSIAAMPSCASLIGTVAMVLNNPGIDLLPSPGDPDATPEASVHRALVDDAIALIAGRKSRRGITTYDDLLTNLERVLASNKDALTQLRRRYRVALIDEFQDTDALQWNVFSTIFSKGETLVLVADPKQAIYSFRGANVYSYIDATEVPTASLSSLTMNHRSDEAAVAATNALFAGVTFGEDRIYFSPVVPTPEARARRLRTAGGRALPGLQIRTLLGPHIARKTPTSFVANSGEVREYVAADLAGYVKELLSTGVLPSYGIRPSRPIRPSDIVVLVRSHADGGTQYRALRRLGIPAVSSHTGSVLDSMAFDHWRYLLRSLERPTDPQRARTAAKSWFFGWTDEQIAANRSEDYGPLHDELHLWADLLRRRGVNAFCTQIFGQSDVRVHALETADGDRNFTDVEHLGEILRSLVPEECTSAAVLRARLEALASERTSDSLIDVTERRVESADDAVQVMTIFAAKGLQFPVVCVPEMYRPGVLRDAPFQHPVSDRRTFDLDQGTHPDSKASMRAESLGEQLRLLYVALTRAEHQTIIWWTRAYNQGANALSHLLFAREDGAIDHDALRAPSVKIPADLAIAPAIERIFAGVGDAFGLAEVDHPDHMAYVIDEADHIAPAVFTGHPLEVASFSRRFDRSYGRWSFTAMTSGTYHERYAPLDETLGDAGAHDEMGRPQPIDDEESADDQLSDLPLGLVPGGAAFGTLVHEILEHVDFASPELASEIAVVVRGALETSSWPVSEKELVEGLIATITSPLGPLFNGRCLRDITQADRLDELNFEIHLGTGPTKLPVSEIGRLVRDHLEPSDPLSPWADRLAADEIDAVLRGHLTGSIDLVCRVAMPDSSQFRYVIADYKTNRLGNYRQPSLARDYEPARLPEAMTEHHYPLQALIYGVGLHRYLRWRQHGYDPDLHLGGAAYLFVRGMAGPMTPLHCGHPNGVFTWRFPPGLIADLSDLLAMGAGQR